MCEVPTTMPQAVIAGTGLEAGAEGLPTTGPSDPAEGFYIPAQGAESPGGVCRMARVKAGTEIRGTRRPGPAARHLWPCLPTALRGSWTSSVTCCLAMCTCPSMQRPRNNHMDDRQERHPREARLSSSSQTSHWKWSPGAWAGGGGLYPQWSTPDSKAT